MDRALPVRRIAAQPQAAARRGLLEDQRAAAGEAAHRLEGAAVVQLARVDRERAAAERQVEVGLRAAQRDRQRVIVERLAARHRREVAAVRALARVALDRPARVLGDERAAVERRDVLPARLVRELEGVGQPVGRALPGARQLRFEPPLEGVEGGPAGEAQQPVRDQVGQHQRARARRERRVERDEILVPADAQHAALARLARWLRQHVGQRQRGVVAPERRGRGRLAGYSSTPASSSRRTSASDMPRYSPSTSTLCAPKTGAGRRSRGGASERLHGLPLSSSLAG